MKTFALIGAAGYIAPRHMHAIKETGNQLVAALDKHDSVGVLDTYFPEAAFFTEFERFDRHLEKLKRIGKKVDYISVCSPNYLHDAHIRFGLRYGAHVICEKPVVLNPWNIGGLQEVENESRQSVSCILQLRVHPGMIALKKMVEAAPVDKTFQIDLTYIASRGMWYYASWKGDESKSGGIVTNIGIHFFDALLWIFGKVQDSKTYLRTHDRASGVMELQRAKVRWFLSTSSSCLPAGTAASGGKAHRVVNVDGNILDLSDGFEGLHTESYRQILAGSGFRLKDAEPAITLTHDLRNSTLMKPEKDHHPFVDLPLQKHPFAR